MTRARSLGVVLLALAVGLGVTAWVWSAQAPEEQRDALYGDPGDRVATAVEALQEDPVHVTPDGRATLPADEAAALSARIRESGLPVHVVVWEPSDLAGYDSPIQAGEQIAWGLSEATGEPAVVVLWGTGTDGGLQATPGWLWRPAVDYDATEPEYLGDAGPRLTEWVEGLPTDDEPLRPLEDDPTVLGGAVLGGLSAVAVLAVLWGAVLVLTALLRRRRGTVGG